MKRSRLVSLGALILVSFATLAGAQDATGRAGIEIQVSSKGKPVAGARVLLRYREAPTGSFAALTDSKGRAAFVNLAAGAWNVEVGHPDYLSYVAAVTLEAGRKPSETTSFLQATGSGRQSIRVKFAKASGPLGTPIDAPPAPPRAEPPPAPPAPEPEPPAPEPEPIELREPDIPIPTAKPEPRPEPPPSPPDSKPESAQAELREPDIPVPMPAPEVEAPEPEPVESPMPEPAIETPPAPEPEPMPEAPEPPAPPTVEPEPRPEAAREAPAPPAVEPEPMPEAAPEAPAPPAVEPEPMPEAAPEAPAPPAVEPEPMPEAAPEVPAPPTIKPEPMPEAAPEAPAPPAVEPEIEAAPQPAPEEPPAEPMPEPAPSPVAPADVPEPTTPTPPVAAPAPETEAAPAPTPAPAPRPASTTLRAFRDRSCPECKPGEWSTASVESADPAGSGESCPADAVESAQRAARLIARAPLGSLTGFAGPAIGGISPTAIELVPGETRGSIGEALRWTSGACRVLAVSIPRGAKFAGFRYEAADDRGQADCVGEKDCPIGESRFLGNPGIERGQEVTVVYSVFENRSIEHQRRVRLTAYFVPGSGWSP